MFAGKEKAWIAGVVGLVSAFALQMTGAGAGPGADQISAFGGMTGDIFAAAVVMAINAVAVYVTPNSKKPM
jgi:hypothetical protein